MREAVLVTVQTQLSGVHSGVRSGVLVNEMRGAELASGCTHKGHTANEADVFLEPETEKLVERAEFLLGRPEEAFDRVHGMVLVDAFGAGEAHAVNGIGQPSDKEEKFLDNLAISVVCHSSLLVWGNSEFRSERIEVISDIILLASISRP